MMSKAAAAVLLTSFSAGNAARLSRHESSAPMKIRGVPVLNYDLAYQQYSGVSSASRVASWVVMAEDNKLTDEEMQKACDTGRWCERVGHPSEGGVPYFVVRATEGELEDVLDAEPGTFRFVEPDIETELPPEEESQASTLWGLDRIGRSTRASEGSGAHVFVMDTGIRTSHVDFSGRASSLLDLTNNTVEICNGASECAQDRIGHGTHCAGSAAGVTFGVASKAQVHAIKTLSDQGRGSASWVYASLEFLGRFAERPAVASLSLGSQGVMAAEQIFVGFAVDAGVTVVVAAGNSNLDACGFSPAYVPAAITVGSINSLGTRSIFSNYGACTNIWAPGSSIISASNRSDDGAVAQSGTSMACPHVSGAAALLVGVNPDLKPADVLEKLLVAAEWDAIVDLKPDDTNALLWVGSGPAPVPAPTPPPTPNFCPLWSAFPVARGSFDCSCVSPMKCSRDGGVSANCPTSEGVGQFSGAGFLYSCTDCKCYETLSG